MNRRDLLKLPAMAGVLQATGLPVAGNSASGPAGRPAKPHTGCDVAAYYWPAYHDEPLWRPFFRGSEGEWEIIRNAKPKWVGHNQPKVPLWGYEDESDPHVMAKKIHAAAAHNVNVLIFDWYWYQQAPFLEKTINEGFLRAENNHLVHFYLMWANHDAATLWDIRRSSKLETIWPGSVDRKNFDAIADRVIEKYFHHPSYYRIDGKPVFSIYDLANLMHGLGGIEPTRRALESFDRRARQAGFPGVHLQAILWARIPTGQETVGVAGKQLTQRDVIRELGFESLTNYQWVHIASPKENNGDYINWAEAATAHWEEWATEFGVPYFPHVSVGWDSNSRFVEPRPNVATNNTPASFAAYMYKARRYAERHLKTKLITVNAWNEWSEGSYLEPDMRNGFGHLDAVKKVMSGEWDF